MSITPAPPFGSTGASAARRMPRMRRTISVAPVSSAPVEPAETTASPSPSRSMFSATVMDASFLWRVAVLGLSLMVMTSLAGRTVICPFPAAPQAARHGRTASSRPTSTMSTPNSFCASTAPCTMACGALSPPMASTMIFIASRSFPSRNQ